MTNAHRFHLRSKLAGLAILAVALVGASAGEAKAVSAPNSVDGVVNVVYWDVDTFWQGLWPASRRPGVAYFDYVNQYNQLQEYATACGSTATQHGTQGFYCPVSYNGDIYFDFLQQRDNLMQVGDGALALWVAHEYGHHAERMLGLSWTAPYHELLADCFAGLYFRWGVYQSRKLAYADYQEARNMIWRLSWNDPTHGTPAQRLHAFDYGFARVGYVSCATGSGWQSW